MAVEKVKRVAILAIGTEITTGQIVDTNSAWLADLLTNLKYQVTLHASVEDDEPAMRRALAFAAGEADFIVVTGGLGPTQDDKTRNVIAAWCGDELVFDEASWQKIVTRLEGFGMSVAESNRQQCYFPARATILTNASGTANAFRVEHDGKICWALPGPPHEIKRIWDDHLAASFAALNEGAAGLKLLRWQTLGHSESAVGELVESIIAGTSLITGYRPHLPYVEVKIWCPEPDLEKNRPVFERLGEALAPWLVTHDDDDLADLFLKQIAVYGEVEIFDGGTGGILSERLGKFLRKDGRAYPNLELSIITEWADVSEHPNWTEEILGLAEPEQLVLAVGPLGADGTWQTGFTAEGKLIAERLKTPYKVVPALAERQRRFVTEATLKYWLDNMRLTLLDA